MLVQLLTFVPKTLLQISFDRATPVAGLLGNQLGWMLASCYGQVGAGHWMLASCYGQVDVYDKKEKKEYDTISCFEPALTT